MLKNNLNVLMAERNLTIQQIHEKSGISRNTISHIVNKPYSNPSLRNVDTLCKILHVGVADFFIDDQGKQSSLANPFIAKPISSDEIKNAVVAAIKEAVREIVDGE